MIEFNDGVHLKDTPIWLDATKKKRLSFLSNPLSTSFVKHNKVITTPQTYKLLERKLTNVNVLPCPYNHLFNLGDIEVEFMPSGFINGSSQILIYSNNKKILYTSDFNLDVLATSEPVEITQCDTLILKSTYGKKHYFFPSPEIAIKAIIDFIDNCFEKDLVPVLLIESLGNSQELAKLLGDEGYRMYVHDSIYKNIKVYEEFGVSFSNCKRLKKDGDYDSRVLMIPPELRNKSKYSKIDNAVFAGISELAIDPEIVKSSLGVDYAFPFSIRAGYDEMIKFVELVRPKEVFVTGSTNVEFSSDLKKKGFNAKAFQDPEQLRLI